MPSTPTFARLAMFSQGNAPLMYCRPRGLNSLWVRSRTVAMMRRCSSVSLNRNESSALMIASSVCHSRASGPIRLSQQPGLEEGAELRRGDHGRRRVGDWLLAMHEAVLGIGIVLPNGRRGTLVQRLFERCIGLHAGDVIVAGLDDMHGAPDVCSKRDRVLLLVGKTRAFDRRVGGGAGFDPRVPRGGHEHIAPTKTEAQHADRRELQVVQHVVDPLLDRCLHPGVGELACARL